MREVHVSEIEHEQVSLSRAIEAIDGSGCIRCVGQAR
jgi:hypothetical protein